MTRPRNKQHDWLMWEYSSYISSCKDWELRKFLEDTRELLEEYKEENKRFRERIKTLKGLIKEIKGVSR
jgi:cell division septum initiation protein DivIVA